MEKQILRKAVPSIAFLLQNMGHSDIGVTLNTYTHFGVEDAAEETKRMQKLEEVRKEMYGEEKEKPMKQNAFKVVQETRIEADESWLFSYCFYVPGRVK